MYSYLNMTAEHHEPDFIFPFYDLKIGQSFFIPTLRLEEMIYLIDTAAKESGLSIRVKSYEAIKDGILGVRTWRVR